MAAAGCRVYAPALPGFGGTRELDAEQRTFAGYAAWVGHFLDAVAVDRVALVAGHSFGGGVATAFVHDQPRRVASLLLVNAIGSPTWALFPNEVRTMMQRPVLGLGPPLRERPPRTRPTCSGCCRPCSRTSSPTSWATRWACSGPASSSAGPTWSSEVRAIAERGIPVSVAWSDRDRLVPRSAFDELRHAAGVEGVVVEGSHAWLIADPEAFGELAISALVDVRHASAPPGGVPPDHSGPTAQQPPGARRPGGSLIR